MYRFTICMSCFNFLLNDVWFMYSQIIGATCCQIKHILFVTFNIIRMRCFNSLLKVVWFIYLYVVYYIIRLFSIGQNADALQ